MSPQDSSDTDVDEISIEEIEVRHKKADDYQIVHADGARGGIQPQGDYKMDFLVEYNHDPSSELYSVENGGLGEPQSEEGISPIIREKQVGVVMRPDVAFSVATWAIANVLGPEVTEEEIKALLADEYEQVERNE